MSEVLRRLHVYSNVDALAKGLADAISTAAKRAIPESGRFRIVLAGGSTPRPIYARLAKLDMEWTHWHIYFSDERCLPINHPQRNDTMARETWLARVPIPDEQIHAIPAELGPEAGASAYARELADVGVFDLTLLGLGEDGHTASLFPGDAVGVRPDAPDALPVHDAPIPPRSRVTLSAARLARSVATYLVVTGKEKRDVLARLNDDNGLPVRSVTPARGFDLYTDAAAWPVAAGETKG